MKLKNKLLFALAPVATIATVMPITLTSCQQIKTTINMELSEETFLSDKYNIYKNVEYTLKGVYVIKSSGTIPNRLILSTYNSAGDSPNIKAAKLIIGDETVEGSFAEGYGTAIFNVSGVTIQDKQTVTLKMTFSDDFSGAISGAVWSVV